MDNLNKFSAYENDPDVIEFVQSSIEKELSNMKKLVDNVNQMRVEVACLESDLIAIIDARTWEDISDFIGLAPMKSED